MGAKIVARALTSMTACYMTHHFLRGICGESVYKPCPMRLLIFSSIISSLITAISFLYGHEITQAAIAVSTFLLYLPELIIFFSTEILEAGNNKMGGFTHPTGPITFAMNPDNTQRAPHPSYQAGTHPYATYSNPSPRPGASELEIHAMVDQNDAKNLIFPPYTPGGNNREGSIMMCKILGDGFAEPRVQHYYLGNESFNESSQSWMQGFLVANWPDKYVSTTFIRRRPTGFTLSNVRISREGHIMEKLRQMR